MNGIENGVIKIIPAIAAGDWETIAKIARQIKASFIRKWRRAPEDTQHRKRCCEQIRVLDQPRSLS